MSVSTALAASVQVSPEKGLIRTVFGEYTASSVAAHPLEAGLLDLVRQRDGNFAVPAFAVARSAAARSSAAVQASLAALALGG